jgi:uncharacterized protein
MRNNTSTHRKHLGCVAGFAVGALALGLAFTAVAQTNDIQPVTLEAEPLPLDAVRLTSGPLQHAQELDAKYLLELQPDKMLFFLRQRAGLPAKTDSGYGGWDGAGRQLTGHIAGHYLSAISYMYAATGNPEFKKRADYIVSELKEIQDKQGDGYIGALLANPPRAGGRGARGAGATNALAGGTNAATGGTNAAAGNRRGRAPAEVVDGKEQFEAIAKGDIRSGGFDLNGMWSPWYVEHKIFAGLRDAYHYTGNKDALAVETKFAGWVETIIGNLTEAQLQGTPGGNGARRTPGMLDTEFGGMNEVLADLYHDTTDLRWLALSDRFEHKAIVNPLAAHNDILGGKHGNTTIPKMLGELSRYVYTGNKTDGDAAKFFWNQVVDHHSYATGGHGHNEYFDAPDQLDKDVDGRDDESCNVYNMLKMTRELFEIHPDVKYAEFMETALFNHVLASIDPNDGRTCYMVPVGRGVTHEYQDMLRDFTCCVGTGMENHALHGYGIYYQSSGKLYVNFYTPNTADWKEAGAKLDMETTFPEGDAASLKFTLQSPKEFTLEVRRPSWAGEGFTVKVNGEPVTDLPKPESYVPIKRTWKSGDTVSLVLPKKLHEEPLPDDTNCVAVLWGPLVLAGDLGPERNGRRGGASNSVPVLVSGDTPIEKWLQPASGKPGEFDSVGVGKSKDVHFVPFYRLPERTYAIYWDTFTKAAWDAKSPEYASQQAHLEKLKAATVGFVQPGQMQAERDANEQASAAEESTVDTTMDHYGRRGSKWFSFDIAVDPAHPTTLVCSYYADEWNKRTFDVLVDGKKIADETIPARGGTKFYDVEYKIPAELVAGKTKVTVRFEATQGNEIGAVYGLRTLRADQMQ